MPSQNPYAEDLTPNKRLLGGRIFGMQSVLDEIIWIEPPDGISSLIKRAENINVPLLSAMSRYSQMVSDGKPGRGISSRIKSASTLTLDFPTSEL